MFSNGIFNLSGSLMANVTSSLWRSLQPYSGSVNIRRVKQRTLYNKLLRGEAFRIDVGETPQTYYTGVGLAKAYLLNSYAQQTATMPSWTQGNIGKKHGFVIAALSSSTPETIRLNAFYSGTQKLENTKRPASGSMFYSKETRFVSKVYKLSASANLPMLPPSLENGPSEDENLSRSWSSGSNWFIATSGSYRNSSIFNPAIFNITVPDYGRIRGVNVWVEFIHDHRGGPGTTVQASSNPFWFGGTGSITAANPKQGLQGVQISLRSPNTNFKYAHPLWNDVVTSNQEKNPDGNITPAQYRQVPELLRNSYLLWAGHACENDLGVSLGALTASNSDNITTMVVSDAPSSASGDVSIAIDSVGYPHLAWGSSGTFPAGGLRYAISGTTGWIISQVTGGLSRVDSTVASHSNLNAYPRVSLALDSLDKAYIAASTVEGNIVCFSASNLPYSNWAANTIVAGTNANAVAGQLSLKIDLNNLPQIAAAWNPDGALTKLIYGVSSSAGWTIQTVAAGTGSNTQQVVQNFYQNSLFIDKNNIPHIAYINPNGNLMYASTGVAGWVSELVATSSFIPIYNLDGGQLITPKSPWGNVSLVIDNFNNPLIAYNGTPNTISAGVGSGVAPVSYIYLARSGTNGWNSELVDKGQRVGIGPGGFGTFTGFITYSHGKNLPSFATTPHLALNQSGIPHILFACGVLNDNAGLGGNSFAQGLLSCVPRLAVSSSLFGWSTKNVNTTASIGTWNSLSIDKSNNIHMAYTRGQGFSTNGTIAEKIGSASLVIYSMKSGSSGQQTYYEYDTDIDMRTVFSDSSKVANPRSMDSLYLSPTNDTPGPSSSPSFLFNRYSSPLSSTLFAFTNVDATNASFANEILSVADYDYLYPTKGESLALTGANFPWMLDDRVPPGNFVGRNYNPNNDVISWNSGTSPIPAGWQTGLNNTNGLNEFSGSGAQIGPANIRPVYPLLDDIFVQKIFDQVSPTGIATLPTNRKNAIGFRPGLRGTEIHGTWQLMIGVAGDWNGSTSVLGNPKAGIWFRQVRLEFIIDQGLGPVSFVPSKNRRFAKPSSVPIRPGNRRIGLISGSAAWDIGINYIYTEVKEEYGRSFGITSQTGSASDQFAVFVRLTGAFADSLTGSRAGVNTSFLQNEYGTPYIPISSGSGIAPSFDAFSAADGVLNRFISDSILNKRTDAVNNHVKSTLNRLNYFKSRRDQILEKVKLVGTFGSSALPLDPSGSALLRF